MALHSSDTRKTVPALRRTGFRATAAAAVLALSVCSGLGTAHADRPDPIDMGLLPSGNPAAPPSETEHPANSPCYDTKTGGDGPTVPTAQRSLDLDQAWQFSKGAGQLVAVIDTGVANHPRLPGLIADGDYVAAGGDGTEDCDAHGTLVAGIIAASQVAGQGFSGVAPEARILTIRQTSALYQLKGASQNKGPDDMAEGYGKVSALASAVRRAADAGASVINISLVACSTGKPSSTEMASLGAAVKYAAEEKNAVIVTSAGNSDHCSAGNPDINPLKPDQDLWSNISTYVAPAWWDDYVLSVGSVDKFGRPSDFTVPGPWVGVAAPGENIVSLDPRSTGLTTQVLKQNQWADHKGTSFAAPYVAGVAALVRARFPQLSAREVIKRIEATAHAPGEGWNPYIGYGTVDPVAALTAEVTTDLPPKRAVTGKNVDLTFPAPPPAPDHTARNVALIGTAAIVILLGLAWAASFPLRRKFGLGEDDA
ncbi:type VII secretion-associated serine protease mycosin [Nocardia huaxiensis]|uniref:Type VII secretion-associated serine protease mycosin n=1 Tax=Nocardia huaxiensis TaxID=2755382 RepID=A0A7D6VDJ3_9NOCA|nr:type VII secretion-associated serine protease mycosin [Nocardia huaxiensis]QLY31902.1 type VII secretion-associated serine protease mycosin [Nocardia huaxiensis]